MFDEYSFETNLKFGILPVGCWEVASPVNSSDINTSSERESSEWRNALVDITDKHKNYILLPKIVGKCTQVQRRIFDCCISFERYSNISVLSRFRFADCSVFETNSDKRFDLVDCYIADEHSNKKTTSSTFIGTLNRRCLFIAQRRRLTRAYSG